MRRLPVMLSVVLGALACPGEPVLQPMGPTVRLDVVGPAEVPNDEATTLSLLGAGFSPNCVVLLGGRALTSPRVLSPAVATVVLPARTAPGVYDVSLVNPDGSRATAMGALTVVEAPTARTDAGTTDGDAGPPLPWQPGAVVPGYVLSGPTGGRSDVRANGVWRQGRWTVLFSRALSTLDPLDDVQLGRLSAGDTFTFAVAVLDNTPGALDATMRGQNGRPSTLGNEASSADLRARSVTSAPSSDPSHPGWGPAFTRQAGDAGAGSATAGAVTLRAAYDSATFYLLAEWDDPTESVLKESWSYDGTTWVRRPASMVDEDRLAIFWNISVPNFATRGCGALCHPVRMGVETDAGPGVINADLWHWKAGRTNPMGFADDQRLVWGPREGRLMAYRADDTGTGIETANVRDGLPASMPEGAPTTSANFLFRWPVGSAAAVPFSQGTVAAGTELPGFVLNAPTGSRSDVRAQGRWASGKWTVFFRRALTTGSPTDDVQLAGLDTGSTYRLSAAVMDNAGGAFDATMSGQHAAPFTLGNESSTADLKAKRVTTAPTADPADAQWGAPFTKPQGTGIAGTATGAPVELRAAFDGATFYLLASWSDATESIAKESWVFDGTRWVRRSARGTDDSWATVGAGDSQFDEDRLALFWDISVPGFETRGCAAMCHPVRMGVETDAGPGVINADLWHWKAARTNPVGYADDQRLVWGVRSGRNMAFRSDDVGTGIETANVSADGGTPLFMGGARFLLRAPAGSAAAVDFRR